MLAAGCFILERGIGMNKGNFERLKFFGIVETVSSFV